MPRLPEYRGGDGTSATHRQVDAPPPPPARPATVNILPWLIGAGGVLLGVLIILLIVLLSGGGPTPPVGVETIPVARLPSPPQSPETQAILGPAATPAPAPKETPAPAAVRLPGAAPPPSRPAYTQKDLDRLASRANLTGLVATLMIHQGRLAEFKELQAKLEQYDKRIIEMIAQTNPPLQPPQSWFQPGDRLTWFSGFGLDPRNPRPDPREGTMARIPMNCRCGWSFFVSDGTSERQITCPSCG